ncbi:33304_t:CDS:2, partial [Racocetra persica]
DSNKLISNLGRIKNNKDVILKENVCKRSGYIRIDLSINSIHISTGIYILVAQENAECKIFPNIGHGSSSWRWIYYEDYIEPDLNKEWEEIEVNSQKFRVSSLGRVQLLNAFCPKEEGKKFVNHIDSDSTNNKVSNLEWCIPRDNIQHAVRLRPQNSWMRQCAVKQIFDNESFQEFSSLTETQRITGIAQSSIRK